MKAQFLKMAGVNSDKEFYDLFPSEDDFFAAYPEAQMMRKGGEMIRRADGSYSQRGLWDNIRANSGSGKKPTAEMLKQERKIKAEMKKGGSTYSGGVWFQEGGIPVGSFGPADAEAIRNGEADGLMPTPDSGLSLGTGVIGDQVFGNDLQARVAKENPGITIQPKKANYNQKLGSVYNKLASNLTNPYSLTNMARMTGDVIDGYNNQQNYQDQLNKQRNNYSTDNAYQAQGIGDTSRGVYDMYNQFIPNKIGGALSFQGMNKRFAAGGSSSLSDFDMIADSVEVPSSPFINLMGQGRIARPDATRVQRTNYAPIPEDTVPDSDIASIIGKKESGNNYKAEARDGKGRLVSSAVGKYQFLWDKHNKDITRVTGVKTKQEFKNNPEAQERFFEYWNQNVLTPIAQEIRQHYNPDMSLNQIKQIVHFQGAGGAKKYFRTGKFTQDAFGSTPMAYLAKRETGGEVEMTEAELQQFLRMGGKVEYC